MDYNFFDDYADKNTFLYDSIRPGRSVSDPTVTNLRVLQYNLCGVIKCKVNFEDEFQELPIRSRRRLPVVTENPSRSKLYPSRQKITETKWKHLQELKLSFPPIVIATMIAKDRNSS